MPVKKDLQSSLNSVKRIVAKVTGSDIEMSDLEAAASGAFQFQNDTENLFPGPSQCEDLEEAASGVIDIMPKRTLRDKHYEEEKRPLVVQPEYQGDFLDKLREQYKNRNAEDCLLDFSMPSEMLKYMPEAVPRDLQDEFYDINRPGKEVGYKDLKQYDDRGWDENDAPEISEDKVLRERNWGDKKPLHNPSSKLFNLKKLFSARNIVANFLREFIPEIETTLPELQATRVVENLRTAKKLDDFKKTLIYTKKNKWRFPDTSGVNVRLFRSEPKKGRWTFLTGKGGYRTIFQFVPNGDIADLTKLHVRCKCECPSWLFWGAQYNALINDYLYGPVRPKFAPPIKRDPTHRFLVCKHVLACIPILKTKEMEVISDETVYDRLRERPAIRVEKGFREKLRIPPELARFERQPEIKQAVQRWNSMTENARREFINGLDSPWAVSFMAHKFPKSKEEGGATDFVIEKLQEMSKTHRIPSFRAGARKLLEDIA